MVVTHRRSLHCSSLEANFMVTVFSPKMSFSEKSILWPCILQKSTLLEAKRVVRFFSPESLSFGEANFEMVQTFPKLLLFEGNFVILSPYPKLQLDQK